MVGVCKKVYNKTEVATAKWNVTIASAHFYAQYSLVKGELPRMQLVYPHDKFGQRHSRSDSAIIFPITIRRACRIFLQSFAT